MHSDKSPAVRTPLCLLIEQLDGQLSTRGGSDIGVSNQISPTENLLMCVRGVEKVHSAKWLLGAYVLMAAGVCVEMKINE